LLVLLAAFAGGCQLRISLPGFSLGGMFGVTDGWDLSACGGSGLRTCAELFVDNQQRLLGGQTVEQLVYNGTVQMLSSLDGARVSLGAKAP
jgi:hypothetical protein